MTRILIEVRGGSVVLVAADEPVHVTLRDLDRAPFGPQDPLTPFKDSEDPYTAAGYPLEVF